MPPGASIGRRRAAIAVVAAAVIAADQASKSWALRHALVPRHVVWTLRLAVTFNSGTAFGLGQGSTPLIIGGIVVLVVVLVAMGRRATRNASWLAVLSMGLLLGGALGNLADRLIRHHHGAVVDFIDLRWWPVFNVADACVTVGAVLLGLVLFNTGGAGRLDADVAVSRPDSTGPSDDAPVGGPARAGGGPPGELPAG